MALHGGPSSILGQGTTSHIPQLRGCMLQLKIRRATTKTWCSPIRQFLTYIFLKTHATGTWVGVCDGDRGSAGPLTFGCRH